MRTKKCTKCKQVKQIKEFYTHSRGGYRSECKICNNWRHKSNNYEYYKKPENKKRIYKRYKTYMKKPKYQQENRVTSTLCKALRAGKINKMPCVKCGATQKIEGHHWDYSKPLDVIWLCIKCHKKLHLANK